MGNIEKLISLGVLCLIVVILAVTFTPADVEVPGRKSVGPTSNGADGRPELAEAQPGSGRMDLEQETGTRLVHTENNRPRPADLQVSPPQIHGGNGAIGADGSSANPGRQPVANQTSPLLNTGVTLTKKTVVTIPAGSILVTAAGLEDSDLEEYKLYRAQANETYPMLAERFYGAASQDWILRRYNEDRPKVVPGKFMFVPVYASAEESSSESTATAAATQDRYLVQEGDSLWTIAKDLYGSGAQWTRIHEANIDVIPQPHDLKPGLRLRIPR